MNSSRTPVSTGRLARLGFADPGAAASALGDLAVPAQDEDLELLVETFGAAADPDRALTALVALVDALAEAERPRLWSALAENSDLRRRLVGVLGMSTGLGQHLTRHPEHWQELFDLSGGRPGAAEVQRLLLEAVGADPTAPEPVAAEGAPPVADDLRVAYRRLLLRLAARDLDGVAGVDDVAAELADLAAGALEAALAVARARLPATGSRCRLAIIGMGKAGGRELNYLSDVDVLFVTDEESDLRAATQLAADVIRLCSDHTGEGTLWPVDAALRPEGKQGALVRTLPSYSAYYERWGETWEFQALLKARPVAGDRGLGAEFVAAVSPLVWTAADHEGFVGDVHAMRQRVVAHIPAGQVDRELKLGPGGLRDVEFAVQLLQLVHGRADESLRSPTTLVALDALIAGGYVGREDGSALAEAYRFLRTLEHRIQLSRSRRTHLMPTGDRELWALGRSLGFVRESVAELTAEWKRHAVEVRRLHEKLFYRPLLAAVARIPGEEARLTPEAAQQRLAALGYAAPAAALRHLEALTSGVSRRAAIQRTLLPVMLEWFADAPDPDAGLLAFRQVSEDLGSTPWFLRWLRDEGATAQRLARVLASSRYAVDLLRREPATIGMLGDEGGLRPRTRSSLESEMNAAAGRYTDDLVAAVNAIRAVRRRELFRIAAADLLEQLPVHVVVAALSDLAVATMTSALSVVALSASVRLAVVGMGRLGGFEMGYASDADVLFVHAPPPGVPEKSAADEATAVLVELRRLLSIPAADPPLVIDANLRPEGRSGPLVRTVSSYASYYTRWSQVWEAQALLRAAPLAGDRELLESFVEVVDPLRYPSTGLPEDGIREIRRLKARVDAERLPRGADPGTHTKLGPGGLADVEWTAQLLQLRHAGDLPALRTTRTLEALEAAVAGGVLEASDAAALTRAWKFATRARNAIMLVRGRPADSLPHDARELAAVARVLGYEAMDTGRFVEDYRRITRRAHTVVDRVFWS